MARNLFEEAGIDYQAENPRNLFAEAGINVDKPKPKSQPMQKYGDTGLLGSFLTGVNNGLVGLAGLPVDTALNVKDLIAMGGGTALHKLGLIKDVNSIPEATNRDNVIGSSAWLANQAKKSDLGQVALNNPVNTPTGRVVSAAGSGVPGMLFGRPQTAGEAVSSALFNSSSGAAGQGAAEMGANPAWQAVASMTPSAIASGGGELVRLGVRGGEQGRQNMAERVKVMNDLGVTNVPPGIATGNPRIALLDSVLSKLPGSNLAYYKNANDIQDRLKIASDKNLALMSNRSGPVEAGNAIQRGLESWKNEAKADVGTLYNYLDSTIPEGQLFPVNNARGIASNLTKDIQGAPNISKQVKESGIQNISNAILDDSVSTPASGTIFVPGKGGRIANIIPATSGTPGGLTYDAIKQIRSEIGPNTQTSALIGDKAAGQYKQLYSALSKDMKNAAALADQQNAANQSVPGVVGPFAPKGLSAVDTLNKANNENRAMMAKSKLFSPYANSPDTQSAYKLFDNTMMNKGPTAQSILNALPADERAIIAATKLDELGKANPGAQTAEGDRFSSDKFLTGINKMSPEVRNTLLSGIPNETQVNTNVGNLIKASDYIKNSSKAFANPSGTAPMAANLTTLGALGGALGSGNYGAASLTGLGLGGSYALGKIIQSPWFINKMLQTSGLTEAEKAGLLFNLSTGNQ